VEHDDTQTVHNNRTITVDGTHTETIKKDTSITITEGNLSHDVVKGTAYYHVKDAVTEEFEANQKTTVTNEIEIESKAFVQIKAADYIELTVGKSTLLMYADGSIELSGVNIAVDGKSQVNVHGGDVISKADSNHIITGGLVESKAGGTNTVIGATVLLNP
jgi:type VI secretion system secreted protein VgrG